jgi:hypothetical protein
MTTTLATFLEGHFLVRELKLLICGQIWVEEGCPEEEGRMLMELCLTERGRRELLLHVG